MQVHVVGYARKALKFENDHLKLITQKLRLENRNKGPRSRISINYNSHSFSQVGL